MAHSSGRFSGIFLCYRRDDSSGHAGRLYDHLVKYFGEDHVFMDLDRIEPGEDFEMVIKEAVGSCETLIVLIGQYWLKGRDVKKRRLDNPKDFVRLEITAALERKVRVIPVLVNGATMPRPEDLPDELAPFSGRQAFELSDRHWKQDVAKLISSLERTLEVRRIIAAQRAAEHQRHAAEETRAPAAVDESDELTAEVPLLVPAAKPVVLQASVERTEVVPLFVPASTPVVREWPGEDEVLQAKAPPARFTKPSPMILAVLALGVAGVLWAFLIFWWVAENQAGQPPTDSNSQTLSLITPHAARAGQNTAPGPTATPQTQTNTNLQPEVVPTPPAKTPAPTATPKATPQATPAAVCKKPTGSATPDESFNLGLACYKGRKPSSLTRADLDAALQHFKRVKSGTHAAEARNFAKQIQKELDSR